MAERPLPSTAISPESSQDHPSVRELKLQPGDRITLYVPEAPFPEPTPTVEVGPISEGTVEAIKALVDRHGEAIWFTRSGLDHDQFGISLDQQGALEAVIVGMRQNRGGRLAFRREVKGAVSSAVPGLSEVPDRQEFSDTISDFVQGYADEYYDEEGTRLDSKPILPRNRLAS